MNVILRRVNNTVGVREGCNRSEIRRDEQENVKDILRSIQAVVTSRNIHKSRKQEYEGRKRGVVGA